MINTIDTYHNNLAEEDKVICQLLYKEINTQLHQAESKIWHGHPVWFLAGNPVVGYSKQKSGVRLLFWSGQSFDEPLLKPEGSFKAAETNYTSVNQIILSDLHRWLKKAQEIQWDYKNIVKMKGVLNRIR